MSEFNMFNDKSVLITGGAGFLGTNLVKRLLQSNAKIRATLHNKLAQIDSQMVDWVKCDLLNADDCELICKDIDILIMAAANTSGAMIIEKTPLVHLTPNLVMNTLLLEAAHKQGVKKVVFISSSTVYPVSDQAMSETDHTGQYFEKYHIVASMKYFTEQMCEMYATKINNPMSVIVIRPGNLYGPFDDFNWETSHVLPAFIRRIVERHQPIFVWGDGCDIKDFIYIDDFIDGMFAAIENTKVFDIYNIGSGQPISLKSILQKLISIDDFVNAEITYDKTKPSMIPIRKIDVAKAQKQLKFSTKTPIEEGLKKTLDWYRRSTT